MKRNRICALSLALILCLLPGVSASALENGKSGDKPYTSYAYDIDGNELPGPAPYYPEAVYDGVRLGTTALYNPEDLFVDEEGGRIFIADTGNNRVVITDSELNYQGEISSFTVDGEEDALSGPSGLYLDSQGYLYVTDKGNGRLVRFDADDGYRCDRLFPRPQTDLLDPNITYAPDKVAVSNQGNIYLICDGIYEGIIEIDENNEFQGYAGMNLATPDLWQLFLRAISTQAQRSAMRAFIPVEFANMDMDDKDFIYATSQLEGNNTQSAVKRLNPGGHDVLNSDWEIVGDYGNQNQGRFTGQSYFTDICYLENGLFVCLDSVRSHIFLYDSDGYCLGIFGDSGNQKGHIIQGAAIDELGQDLLVLDAVRGQITVFRTTLYGEIMLRAVGNYNAGNYDIVLEDYQELLRMNSNSEVAYTGIGKVMMREHNYREAMRNFALANQKEYYSRALGKYRDELISENFVPIFILVVAIAAWFALKKQRKALFRFLRKKLGITEVRNSSKRTGRIGSSAAGAWFDRQAESVVFGTYVMLHPFKGFWELKREGRGTVAAAVIILAGFSVVNVCKATFTGLVFRQSNAPVNTVYEAVVSLIPVVLFIIANWCFTTLMDGEGSFKDIFIATSFALLPFILFEIPVILMSSFLTIEEGTILTVIETAMYLYIALLIYCGNLTIHQYTAGKAVGMLLLTILGMAIIIFLVFLFVNLGFEVVGFVESVYKEIVFRT